MIAWARARLPVGAKVWLMWVLTVDRLTNSWAAISALDRPWAIRASTSPSRSVSPSGRPAPGAPGAPGAPTPPTPPGRGRGRAGGRLDQPGRGHRVQHGLPRRGRLQRPPDVVGAGVLGQVAG